MPRPEQIAAACKSIRQAIETKPSSKERKLPAGLMLQGLCVRASDDVDGYIGALCFKLADVLPDRGEKERHIPLPAFAHAVSRLWDTLGDNYGRPPPISTVLADRRTYSDAETPHDDDWFDADEP